MPKLNRTRGRVVVKTVLDIIHADMYEFSCDKCPCKWYMKQSQADQVDVLGCPRCGVQYTIDSSIFCKEVERSNE